MEMTEIQVLRIDQLDNVERFPTGAAGQWRGYLFSVKYERCEEVGECVCEYNTDDLYAWLEYQEYMAERERMFTYHKIRNPDLIKPIFAWQGAKL